MLTTFRLGTYVYEALRTRAGGFHAQGRAAWKGSQLVRGLSNPEIWARLVVSETTAKTKAASKPSSKHAHAESALQRMPSF